MAHAESNRSPALTQDTDPAASPRFRYAAPRLLKVDLAETEGGGGPDLDGTNGSNLT
jgi:hypothetical protein